MSAATADKLEISFYVPRNSVLELSLTQHEFTTFGQTWNYYSDTLNLKALTQDNEISKRYGEEKLNSTDEKHNIHPLNVGFRGSHLRASNKSPSLETATIETPIILNFDNLRNIYLKKREPSRDMTDPNKDDALQNLSLDTISKHTATGSVLLFIKRG